VVRHSLRLSPCSTSARRSICGGGPRRFTARSRNRLRHRRADRWSPAGRRVGMAKCWCSVAPRSLSYCARRPRVCSVVDERFAEAACDQQGSTHRPPRPDRGLGSTDTASCSIGSGRLVRVELSRAEFRFATFPAALIERRPKRTPVDASVSMLFEKAYGVTIANAPSE